MWKSWHSREKHMYRWTTFLWKGRLQWKQYIPSERSHFGFKLFVLCESSSGYIWNFIVYPGSDTDFGNNYPNLPITSRVVLKLSHDLLNKSYNLHLDNWYTSIELAKSLCSMNMNMIGTIQKNRKGLPDVLTNTRLKEGEHIARFNDKIMVLHWKDKRDVYTISTWWHVWRGGEEKPSRKKALVRGRLQLIYGWYRQKWWTNGSLLYCYDMS